MPTLPAASIRMRSVLFVAKVIGAFATFQTRNAPGPFGKLMLPELMLSRYAFVVAPSMNWSCVHEAAVPLPGLELFSSIRVYPLFPDRDANVPSNPPGALNETFHAG